MSPRQVETIEKRLESNTALADSAQLYTPGNLWNTSALNSADYIDNIV